jgi:hypothetical protein
LNSAVLNVTVKYIGAINQLNFTSSSGSTSVTTNGSVQVPCGQQALTLTIPTPTTDPTSAITYTWLFPWGTQTTSSPSVSTTATAGGSGTINVSAKRNDGIFVQSFAFSVTRPVVGTPTITSEYPANDNATCPGEGKLYKMTASNATTFTWSPVSTGTIYNLNSQITYTQLNSKTTLTATVDNACQSPQTSSKIVYVGSPTIETATVNGGPQSTPNYIYNPCLLNLWTNEIGVTYNWQVVSGSGNIYYNGQNQVSVYAYPFVLIQGSISNRCGSASTNFYLYDVGGGYYRMASSNPTTGNISADITLMGALKKMTLVSDARPGIVRMYNANGSLNADTHRNNNLLSFDVANLPRGLYHLNFVFEGNKTFTEHIVLN